MTTQSYQQRRGELNGQAKLTSKEVLEIRKYLKTRQIKWIAEKYGVCYSNIEAIKTGRTWSWLQ